MDDVNKKWDVGCIVKWYGIIDKIAFWDGKIGQDGICYCECSQEELLEQLSLVLEQTNMDEWTKYSYYSY